MKNKFLKYTLGLAITAFTLVSCDDDQNLDQSTLVPTNPTVSVALSFDNSTTLVEQNIDYSFTVSLSEPQVVDVKVYLSQTGGDATLGEDYDMPDSVIIPANSNSVTGVISILEDDTIEDLETVIITIGAGVRTANANVNATTVTFNIANLTTGDLLANLSWAASELTTDNSGTEIEATDLADMRLLVTDLPYTTIIDVEDEAGFETITLDASTPDGEYYIVADFFSASEIPADLDLTISFDQVGVINGETYTFPAALNTGRSCESVYFIMAKVIKSGTSYTVSEIGETNLVSAAAAPFIGTATVLVDDWEDYAIGDTVEIEAGSSPNEFWIRSYSNSAIANPSTAYLIATINPLTSSVTVVSNEDYEYGCSEGDIIGAGTVNECTGTIDIILDYDLGNCGAFPAYQLILEL